MATNKPNLRDNRSLYRIETIEASSTDVSTKLKALYTYVVHTIPQIEPDCKFGTKLFEKIIPEGLYFVLYNSANEIIGYTWTSRWLNSRYIHHLCTSKSLYKGAGSVLIEYIKNYVRNEGLSSITLRSLPSAIGFYKSVGFQKEKEDCTDTQSCGMIFHILRGGRRLTKKSVRRQRRGLRSRRH
jgi:hypothetical protein